MEDEATGEQNRTVTQVLDRLASRLGQFRVILSQHMPDIIDSYEGRPAAAFGTLVDPLRDAHMRIVRSENRHQTDSSHNEAHILDFQDFKPGMRRDPHTLLGELDHELSALLVEVGFTLTMTSGKLPRDVHQLLSGLLASAEVARAELDNIAEGGP